MARRFLDDIRADIATLLADNTTGDISPADLRLIMLDLISSTVQDECYLESTQSTDGIALTTAFSVLGNVFQASSGGDNNFLNPNTGTGTVTLSAVAGFSYQIRAVVSFQGNQNEVFEFAILRDGVPTAFKPDVAGAGTQRAVSALILAAVNSNAAGEEIQIAARAVDGSATIDVQDAILEVTVVPTNGP